MEQRLFTFTLITPDKTFEKKVQGEEVVLGRDQRQALHYPHKSLSRKHCKFFYRDQQIFVVDLGSSNGTRVNGQKIPAQTPTALGPQTQVTFPSAQLKIEVQSAPVSAAENSTGVQKPLVPGLTSSKLLQGTKTHLKKTEDTRANIGPLSSTQQQFFNVEREKFQNEMEEIIHKAQSEAKKIIIEAKEEALVEKRNAEIELKKIEDNGERFKAHYQQQSQQLKEEIDQHLADKAKLTREFEQLQSQLQQNQQQLQQKTEQLTQTAEKVQKAREELQQLRQNFQQETLDQKSERANLVADFELQKKNLEAQLAEIMASKRKHRAEWEEIKEQRDREENYLQDVLDKVQQSEESVVNFREEIKTFRDERDDLKAELNRLNNQIKDDGQHLNSIEKKLQRANHDLEQSQEELLQSKEEVREIKQLITEIDQRHQECQQQFQLKQQLHTELSQELQSLEELKKEALSLIEIARTKESDQKRQLETLEQEKIDLENKRLEFEQETKERKEKLEEQIKAQRAQVNEEVAQIKGAALEQVQEQRQALEQELKLTREEKMAELEQDYQQKVQSYQETSTRWRKELKELDQTLKQRKKQQRSDLQQLTSELEKRREEKAEEEKALHQHIAQQRQQFEQEQQEKLTSLTQELAKMKLIEEQERKERMDLELKRTKKIFQKKVHQLTSTVTLVMDKKFQQIAKLGAIKKNQLTLFKSLSTEVEDIMVKIINDRPLPEGLYQDIKTKRKVKKFWAKVILGVTLPTATLIFFLLGKEKVGRVVEKQIEDIKQAESASTSYIKKVKRQIAEERSFRPKMRLKAYPSYADSILYTSNYAQNHLGKDFLKKWIVHLNQFLIKDLSLSDNLQVKVISLESHMIRSMQNLRDKIRGDQKESGISALREEEAKHLLQLKKLLKSEENYLQFQRARFLFYNQWVEKQRP